MNLRKRTNYIVKLAQENIFNAERDHTSSSECIDDSDKDVDFIPNKYKKR